MNYEAKLLEEKKLLANIPAALPQLEEPLRRANDKWSYEDGVYRFYHESMKVFYIQELTCKIVAALQALAPHLELNEYFQEIVKQGTGREFTFRSNDRWAEEARPIIEAFLHARYFLEMVCKYGPNLKEPPDTMPSGWAAVLYLYRIRQTN